MPSPTTRRQFLKKTAFVAVASAVSPARGLAKAPVRTADAMPAIKLGSLEVSRVFLGSNPFFGFAHGNPQGTKAEMKKFYTGERVMAVLDEAGSPPGATTLRTIANGLDTIRAERPRLGILAIGNHPRPLDHLHPDRVHVLVDGRIVASGGTELANQFETDGHESFT